MFKKIPQIIFILFIFCFMANAQNKSIYTGLSDKDCKALKSSDEDTDSYEGECPGVGGYKLRLLEDDLRQTINVISPTKKKSELNLWYFNSGFSSVGAKAEWRMKGKVPVGLIVRYNVSGGEDSSKITSYLFVIKVSKTASCVVDIIMPSKTQNAEAQKSADSASTKPCKETE
ncbi:MAG: hypothetical protein MUC29_14205 [Pyrinomonadaceae bacterium]|jgi:hypothetical protein|nr:hypothetical protein [Pyrinomonadaceae bacterium]